MSLPLKVVSVLSLLLSGGAAAPSFPVWPSQFSVDFNETTSGVPFLSGKTTGKFYYDAAHHRSLTTRVNGKYDRYCGSERIGKSTACNHLVTNGIRYLVFPDLEFCCACCNAAAGCDILKPNWLVNATFMGNVTYSGLKAYKWNQPGLQANYYYETIKGRVPIGIDQAPNDNTIYEVATYSTSSLDPTLFDIPSYCTKGGQCRESLVCDAL